MALLGFGGRKALFLMRASLFSIPSHHGLGFLVLLCCLLSATSTTGLGAWLPQRPRSIASFLDGDFAGGGGLSHDYGLDLFWFGLRRSDPVLSLRSGDARLNDDGVGGIVVFLLCSLKGVESLVAFLLFSLKGIDDANLKQRGDGDGSIALVLIGVFFLQYEFCGLAVFCWVRSEVFELYSEIQLEWVILLGWAIGEGGLPLSVVT